VQVRVDLAGATEQAVTLHFQIRDTGIGIPPDELETIFEPFETGHGAGEPASGTGLGLAISTELVGLMGGEIWVESEPEVGSTFHFTIQAGLEERAIPQPRPPVQGEPQVLVLSDQSRSGAAIAAGVGSERARTTIVSSPERIPEVLDQGAAAGTDVVVVDVRRDAIAVATEIAARAPHLTGRVLLVMPYGQRGDAARCRRLGLGGYLTGQIDGSLMCDAVDAVASDTGELITRHLLRELGRQK
jgi:CheY-like chemotaxis protein